MPSSARKSRRTPSRSGAAWIRKSAAGGGAHPPGAPRSDPSSLADRRVLAQARGEAVPEHVGVDRPANNRADDLPDDPEHQPRHEGPRASPDGPALGSRSRAGRRARRPERRDRLRKNSFRNTAAAALLLHAYRALRRRSTSRLSEQPARAACYEPHIRAKTAVGHGFDSPTGFEPVFQSRQCLHRTRLAARSA